MAPYDYETPAHAQRIFRRLVAARREQKGHEDVAVLDLCCSYGVNAALLNHELTLRSLYERYCSDELDGVSSAELSRADRQFFGQRRRPSAARVLGVDSAANAVRYAQEAGLLERGWSRNLEEEPPDAGLRAHLSRVDLVTVTGGIGYITEQTFARILGARHDEHFPWVAAFALRWVDFSPIEAILADHGLVTEKWERRTFPQRRFTDSEEREYAISELRARGIDPDGKESEGRFHAELYVARPRADTGGTRLGDLFEGMV
ncbi:MAG: hypothetical protein ACRDY7_03035 [Acidimicrobiia bacterium]